MEYLRDWSPEAGSYEKGPYVIVMPHKQNSRVRTIEWDRGKFKLGPYEGERLSCTFSSDLVVHLLEEGELACALTEGASVLSLEEQLEVLATSPARALPELPSLPPYTVQQVYGIEAAHQFRFPPLMRSYALQISRDIQFAISTSLTALSEVYAHDMDCVYVWAELPDDLYLDESFLSLDASTRLGYVMYPILDGPLKSFVLMSGMPRDIFADTIIVWATSFEAFHPSLDLSRPALSDVRAVSQPLEDLIDPSMLQNAPQSLKSVGCKDYEIACCIFGRYWADEKAVDVCVSQHIIPAAVKIQRQFRLWQWRMQNIFNPHTHFGHLNLLIKARAAVSEQF